MAPPPARPLARCLLRSFGGAGQLEPLVVVRGDLGTALAGHDEAPGGGGEDAWLAGHVGPAGDRLVRGAQGGVRWKTVEWPVGGAMET